MIPEGINSRIKLAEYFSELGFTTGAEIGVAAGNFSEVLCKTIPGLKLLCVDPWEPYPENKRGGRAKYHNFNYGRAVERMAPYNATLVRKRSHTASLHIPNESLDFVFIDGNHEFDFVMLDILLWVRKVRPGGVVSGHDYYSFNYSGVIEAVDAYCSAHNITPNIIPWYEEAGRRDDRKPCWWWVKPCE